MKVVSVVGARPNFMKIAPLVRAVQRYNAVCKGQPAVDHVLVHTGQHYDDRMSRAFFEELAIPDADINLEIGSGTHAEQVGRTMIAFEKVLHDVRPDWVIVVGDVNATCACSITAKKEGARLAHIEAGLRSRDMTMPEEINRLVTDRLSDLLFTPDRFSGENLRAEGVPEDRIRFVGNIMIDTLEYERAKAAAIDPGDLLRRNQLEAGAPMGSAALQRDAFAVVTLHRPSNVDDAEVLRGLVRFFVEQVTGDMPLVWPIHPRTRRNLETFGLWGELQACTNLFLLQPLGYHDTLRLNMDARVMLTDSGGLQEECCVLGTPCLTLRWNTERPVTLKEHGGVSVLVGNDLGRIRSAYSAALLEPRKPTRPESWDGRTAERIVTDLVMEAAKVPVIHHGG